MVKRVTVLRVKWANGWETKTGYNGKKYSGLKYCKERVGRSG